MTEIKNLFKRYPYEILQKGEFQEEFTYDFSSDSC